MTDKILTLRRFMRTHRVGSFYVTTRDHVFNLQDGKLVRGDNTPRPIPWRAHVLSHVSYVDERVPDAPEAPTLPEPGDCVRTLHGSTGVVRLVDPTSGHAWIEWYEPYRPGGWMRWTHHYTITGKEEETQCE